MEQFLKVETVEAVGLTKSVGVKITENMMFGVIEKSEFVWEYKKHDLPKIKTPKGMADIKLAKVGRSLILKRLSMEGIDVDIAQAKSKTPFIHIPMLEGVWVNAFPGGYLRGEINGMPFAWEPTVYKEAISLSEAGLSGHIREKISPNKIKWRIGRAGYRTIRELLNEADALVKGGAFTNCQSPKAETPKSDAMSSNNVNSNSAFADCPSQKVSAPKSGTAPSSNANSTPSAKFVYLTCTDTIVIKYHESMHITGSINGAGFTWAPADGAKALPAAVLTFFKENEIKKLSELSIHCNQWFNSCVLDYINKIAVFIAPYEELHSLANILYNEADSQQKALQLIEELAECCMAENREEFLPILESCHNYVMGCGDLFLDNNITIQNNSEPVTNEAKDSTLSDSDFTYIECTDKNEIILDKNNRFYGTINGKSFDITTNNIDDLPDYLQTIIKRNGFKVLNDYIEFEGEVLNHENGFIINELARRFKTHEGLREAYYCARESHYDIERIKSSLQYSLELMQDWCNSPNLVDILQDAIKFVDTIIEKRSKQ